MIKLVPTLFSLFNSIVLDLKIVSVIFNFSSFSSQIYPRIRLPLAITVKPGISEYYEMEKDRLFEKTKVKYI